ncbi:MAG: hypothetical protein WA081_13365 [Desulfosalsimonadaceae bacterium]
MLNACPVRKSYDLYEPRHPRKTHYFQCAQHHFEDLETAWDDRYQHQYGFFRPYARDVIWRYLDCGDLHLGFAWCGVAIVAMNISCRFHVSAVISARPAIRNGWLNSANGCARKY